MSNLIIEKGTVDFFAPLGSPAKDPAACATRGLMPAHIGDDVKTSLRQKLLKKYV